jgi:hypothetical protein
LTESSNPGSSLRNEVLQAFRSRRSRLLARGVAFEFVSVTRDKWEKPIACLGDLSHLG